MVLAATIAISIIATLQGDHQQVVSGWWIAIQATFLANAALAGPRSTLLHHLW